MLGCRTLLNGWNWVFCMDCRCQVRSGLFGGMGRLGAIACALVMAVSCDPPPSKPTAKPSASAPASVASAISTASASARPAGSTAAEAGVDAGAVAAADAGSVDAATGSGACPSGMVHVEGDYCMTVRHQCVASFAEKEATGSLGFDDQCWSYAPGSAQCGTGNKKVAVQLKLIPGDKHDQTRADTKHAYGKKYLGVKVGDKVNGCTVEKVLGYGAGVAREGSSLVLDCPPIIRLSFCMDRYEYPNKAGATPARLYNWYDAQDTCEKEGKRLCEEQEWTLACEGPERQPYANGWKREVWKPDDETSRNACNISRCHSDCPPEDRDSTGQCTQFDPNLGKEAPRPPCYVEPEWVATQIPFVSDAKKQKYFDMIDKASGNPQYPFLLPSGSMKRCVSPYGIYDMPGNIDEWVQSFDNYDTKISNLKGGHYLHNCRARCRPVTTRHGPYYFQGSIGFRCCADPGSTAGGR